MASRGVNKVILVGNLGQDPDVRYFPDGGCITTCSLATSETWKDKNTGQQQERTEWHRVVFKDRGRFTLGKIAGEYLKKGSKIYVEGQLQTRKWDKDGETRYSTDIVVNEMQMLDSKPMEHTGTAGPAPKDKIAPAPAQPDFDDDIPF